LIGNDNYDLFKKEFDSLSEYDEDPVGQWLKIAKAKGETQDSDAVLLKLVVELHRKIDGLTKLIKNEEEEFLNLEQKLEINAINYEYFKVEQPLKVGQKYYGRVLLPAFPKRLVPVFFTAIEQNIANIELMHDKDTRDWDAYMAAKERIQIRELKGKK
jgi:hypothetical protein